MKRTASAQWRGDLKNGKGTVSTASGVLSQFGVFFPDAVRGRQGHEPRGTAGGGARRLLFHGAFGAIGQASLTAESIQTTCTITLEKQADGFAITESHLDLKARVPGRQPGGLRQAVQAAKTGCPVSKLYKTNITLTAKLEEQRRSRRGAVARRHAGSDRFQRRHGFGFPVVGRL